MSKQITRATVNNLAKKLNKVKTEYKAAITVLQKNCQHKQLAECDYKPSRYDEEAASPPIRVCKRCGVRETGWGCGYKLLISKNIQKISRDDLFKMCL